MISVPKEAMSWADGPPRVTDAVVLVGTARSEICCTPSIPGGWIGCPGISSSTPLRLAADWLATAARSITLAVPSSPRARLAGSAVTMSPSTSRALTAISMSRVRLPAAGTLRGTRESA